MKWKSIILAFIFSLLFISPVKAAPEQYVYDRAGLLTNDEVAHLEQLAEKLSAEREIAFIILTTNDTNGQYIKDYMSYFVDNNRVGYESSLGSTAIIALDMANRDVYLGGFGKGEEYLDDNRLTKIRQKVTPLLSEGDYEGAFERFIEQSHYYSQFKPGFNPDNVIHKLWFQLLLGVIVGAIVVLIMVANRGTRSTVNQNTYVDSDNSGVVNSKDQYLTTNISKVRKPENNGGGGSGGGMAGGGFSGSGRSFSGSGGKF